MATGNETPGLHGAMLRVWETGDKKRLGYYWHNASVSSGTLLASDLIPVFLEVAHEISTSFYISASEEWDEIWNKTDSLHEQEAAERADELLVDLFDLLNDYAPVDCYFGTLEGDGAAFGFWEIEAEESE